MRFKKVWFSETEYKIQQIRDVGPRRFVDEDYGQYVQWLAEGNVPEEVPLVVPTETSNESKWAAIRESRNCRLKACDWTQLPDAPLTTEQVVAWQTYRQVLRDIPNTFEDPDVVEWPEFP